MTRVWSSGVLTESGLRVEEDPLIDAVNEGDIDRARDLLKRGSNVNCVTKRGKFTPLIIASRKQDPNMVRLLLENGANMNQASEVSERVISLSVLDCSK